MQRNITTEEVKLIQKIQLDILKEVDRICKSENIRYGIDGGTLLGAIRHKGFIPWDPDVDVIMLREDYEKFYNASLRLMNNNKYFLQEERTDSYYRWGFTKIRRVDTNFVRVGQEHLKMQNGIFIDILIMDNVPDNYIKRKLYEAFCYCCRFVMWSEVGKYEEKNKFKKFLYILTNQKKKKKVFAILKKVQDRCNSRKTKLVRYMTCRYTYNKKLEGIDRSYFDKFQEYTFEGCKFPGFYDYDNYLTLLYGDYMKLPPVEKRVSHMPVSYIKLVKEEDI